MTSAIMTSHPASTVSPSSGEASISGARADVVDIDGRIRGRSDTAGESASRDQRPWAGQTAETGTNKTTSRASVSAPAPADISATSCGRDRIIIRMCGRLDQVGVARLRTAVAGARTPGTPQLHLDLSAVTDWDRDSARHGLVRALAWARMQLREHDQSLTLIGVPTQLRTEVESADRELECFFWHGPRPGHPRYRPETADQP